MANTSVYAVFERMWQHVLTKCDNYATIGALETHAERQDNPHLVSAEQIGVTDICYTKSEVNDLIDEKIGVIEYGTY